MVGTGVEKAKPAIMAFAQTHHKNEKKGGVWGLEEQGGDTA